MKCNSLMEVLQRNTIVRKNMGRLSREILFKPSSMSDINYLSSKIQLYGAFEQLYKFWQIELTNMDCLDIIEEFINDNSASWSLYCKNKLNIEKEKILANRFIILINILVEGYGKTSDDNIITTLFMAVVHAMNVKEDLYFKEGR